MKQLRENKPVWHALLWIAVYVALVNVGGVLGSSLGGSSVATGALLAGLAAGLRST